MEISGNKYLHKKFKKQTSCNPVYNVEDKNDNSVLATATNTNNGERTGSSEKEPANILLYKDNKLVGSVPNYKSTNCDGSLVIETQDSERIIDRSANTIANANLKLDNQSSISNVEVSVNVTTKEPVECYRTQTITTSNVTSCISKVITTTTSLLGNDFKENTVRNFSFDTKYSISEPIPNIEKSSILDTIYSKSSLISERPNAAGIKLDVDESTPKITKTETDVNHITENIQEKKNCTESSGGKYVCTYCNLACSKPSVLQKHIRAHTNERPYPCVSCGFSFKTRSNLYKHCRSRTHANRVMGNKHVQAGQVETVDIDGISERGEDRLDYPEDTMEYKNIPIMNDKPQRKVDFSENSLQTNKEITMVDQKNAWEQKSKPYKPRFHTAFFEENKLKENDSKLDNITISQNHISKSPNSDFSRNKLEIQEPQNIRSTPEIIKLRINELIHKNNSIVNCDDAVVIRRRNLENIIENNNEYLPSHHVQWSYQPVDEPLNLTSKNRKRCLSETTDNAHPNKSLIKELLLKNLSSDPNLQCQYCKMIFQTVTELEMHKIKYCNAKHSNIRYARSSSVNVASILTQNKNAFDNIPHMQHTTFPLKSPGPFLGKTRLIDSEKSSEKHRTFSFDDNVIMHHSESNSPSYNKYMMHSPVGTYPLSPQIKKNPIKLFGGEVKITQTSGETRSFKIESESINKMEEPHNFMEFSGNLSENLVIKSTLQSGGTVLQNKSNYSPKMDSMPSPNIFRAYDNVDMTQSNLNLPILNDKAKFTYDKISQPNIRQNDKLLIVANNEMLMKRRFPVRDKTEPNYSDNTRTTDIKLDSEKDKEIYKSNLMDFGQKAVKLLAPNLKPPNLTIPGLPIPSAPGDKIMSSPVVTIAPLEINTSIVDRENIMDRQHQENLNFAKKQIFLQQRMAEVSQPQTVFNPMNILVNGKVIRYVPGMPGPVVADTPTELAFNPTNVNKIVSNKISKSPRPPEEKEKEKVETPTTGLPLLNGTQFERKTPTIIIDQHERKTPEAKTLIPPRDRVNNLPSRVSPTATVSSPEKTSKEESRKFVRPTSLALKPNSVAFKNHHGLTPTMFNQALISPDTPRVAKKYCQQYLNGNYFSYLGLKSSTKSVYCTLNKTQPFYVKHFKKLSMYSEWRQQESKLDSLSVSAYDSRQQQQKYTMAGHAKADLVAHSSYKFVKTETQTSKEENTNKNTAVFGGYESNEDYTYIRGRGRGRYVCDQCGIRCKKPSMLKKHIRTHSDDRPYTCEHCNFSFKTKGNLTKHMKSKAHSKKYAATSSTSAQNSVTTSSESEESDAESSDESTRLQEHEAAHCLLSLSQKPSQTSSSNNQEINSTSSTISSTSTSVSFSLSEFPSFLKDDKFLKNADEISQVNNTNFAKNKILDETSVNFNATKHLTEVLDVATTSSNQDSSNVTQYLGKSSTIRPLTYPYQQTQLDAEKDKSNISENTDHIPKIITTGSQDIHQRSIIKSTENKFVVSNNRDLMQDQKFPDIKVKRIEEVKLVASSPQVSLSIARQDFSSQNVEGNLPANIVFRKRKLSTSSNIQYKVQRNDSIEPSSKAVDLSMPLIQNTPVLDLSSPAAVNGETISFNGAFLSSNSNDSLNNKFNSSLTKRNLILNHDNHINSPRTGENSSESSQITLYNVNNERVSEPLIVYSQNQKPRHNSFSESNSSETFSQNSDTNDRIIGKMNDIPDNSLPSDKDMYKSNVHVEIARSQSKTPEYGEQDQSAMQTLAEIAIKQVKLEKNILAKNVASEYLKLALNNEGSNQDGNMKKFNSSTKESVNELMVKPEESKNCTICSKNFSKPSQLRLHMNIHYLERPFRCESCSVSFRTRGHLQKHERSASHHNKLSSSPALSSQEPRPFKCTDCNIAFRIHGHLAKHLRSKMHIMKLECLAKIPFGLYAELERANSLLTEINTTDGDLCLESLKILAKKLFINDPSKLDQLGNAPDSRDS